MGRLIIIVLAVAGLLPLLGDAKALDATTGVSMASEFISKQSTQCAQ